MVELEYSNATTCSASGTDPVSGITQTASVTATHSYSVVTSNGAVSGAPSSIELRAVITANANSGGLLASAESDASGTMEMCFDVHAGAYVGWQLIGNLETSGPGFAKVRLSGTDGGSQQDIPQGSGSFGFSGRVGQGNYCLWLAYGSGADADYPGESFQSSVRLTLVP